MRCCLREGRGISKDCVFEFNHGRLKNGSSVRGDTGPKVSALLGNRSRHGRSLHLSLVVDNDSSVILEVNKDSLLPAETLALADNDGGHDLLPQLGLSLLHGSHNHVAGTGLRVPVKAPTGVTDSDDVEVLSSGVVGAVDDGSSGKTSGDLVLDSGSEGASTFSFLSHVILR